MKEPKRGSDPAGDFAEIWESERRNASYLWVVTGALLVLLLALSTGWCRSASRTLQPVFVRVDEIGRAEALDYEALTWQNDPLHPSTKYFLRQFVSDHYSRRFATVAERWPHSLAFLERSLAAASAEAHQQEVAEFSAGLVRERWTTNMQFVFQDVDPYELTTNPIGLTITYYAEDRTVSSGG